MKLVRFFVKTIFYIFLIACILIFSAMLYIENSISKDFKIKKGDVFSVDTFVPVTAVYNGAELSRSGMLQTVGEQYDVSLKMFGVIPISTVSVEVVDELHVAVLGNLFGMKLYTEGVLVVETTEVETEKGNVKPAEKAGIKTGDYILSVDGEEITTNEDLSRAVEKSNGEKMQLVILRKGKKIHIGVKAALSADTGNYKIGLWVRDSSAGIGTLTFYSPATGVVCGLGHGICDEDTGTLLQLDSGELVSAEILTVEKGCAGSPGQLKGKFRFETIGEIDLNCECGVYSALTGKIDTSSLTEIALKQEVTEGRAQILCTVEGDTPKLYDCTVELRASAFLSSTQNMMVTVTDSELLSATGGIVQGMSGSPVVQNGKLVGAITHVLVDDPTRGYAIFAENMLETAQSVAEEKKLKEAS
ncbi:MAG: SpoIVB peptidase [Clostridia bacterium]|nr:SpoIVB peptidase [Clostridia bacterium]